MEVDLDSLITTTSSDDDDFDFTPYLRTVDEILNDDSDSSLPSSPTPPPFSPSLSKQVSRIPERGPLYQSPALERPDSGSLEEEPPGPSHRRSTRQLSSSTSLPSLGLRGNPSSRSLPPLFGGIRSSSRPGAALAAAAAASRSIPTPHAAKIKWKKANSIEGLDSNVRFEGSQGIENLSSKVIVFPGLVDDDEAESPNLSSSSSDFSDAKSVALDVVNNSSGILVSNGGNVEILVSNDGSRMDDETEASITDLGETTVSLACTSEVGNTDLANIFTGSVEETDHFSLQQLTPQRSSSCTVDDNVNQLSSEESSNINKSEKDDNDTGTSDDGESFVFTEELKTISDTLGERTVQFETNKNDNRKAGKKLHTSMKPLEWAEELEKRKASSGLHWEEGAAAQPMRLEGIKRERPAVGYLQIDPDNAITRTISSQGFCRDHGSPQVLATHVNYIAIGTSKGIGYVVSSKYSAHSADNIDSKMMVLTSQSEKANVTSMCFNQQGDLLLAGYGDGHVIIWDTQKGVAAKVMAGEHLTPVVHALFLGQDSQVGRQFKAVTGDVRGLVLLHTFSVVPLLNRFSVKTQCLLDGKKTGIVLSVSPLLMDDSHLGAFGSVQGNLVVPSSGLSSMVGGVVGGVVGGETGWKFFNEGTATVEEGVVVFVTHQNALVVRLTPSLEVYANLPKPDGIREGSIPYTAWKCAHFPRGSSKDASEVISWLVIAWDRKIQVLKLVKSELKMHKEWSVDSGTIGVAWLDDQMLVVLTSRKQLYLFSRDGDELYRTNYVLEGSDGDDNIAYHTYFNNSLGNPEKAYHNSVAVRGSTIYILGPSHLTVSRLLPWKERIQVLLKAGDWMGALDMSMRLYDGHAHGVVDLPRTVEMIREVIMPYLVELILSYVDEVFSYISVSFSNQHENISQTNGQNARSMSAVVELEEQFARVGGVAVEFCIHIRRTDILFDGIFSRFVAVQHEGTFLEILEPYILKDMLGCVPPEIMQALVEHYSTKGWLERVEQCVLHMDISSLDFNQIVRLCREHALYGALIYLFNQGLDDYKTPLEELLLVAQNFQITEATAIGYRMLVYLKHCFLGLAFPPGHGRVSLSRLPSLKEELLQFLLQDSNALTSEVVRSFKKSHGALPKLCFLLWLDTEATLDVLRHALSKNTQEKSENAPESVVSDNMLEEREISSENTVQDMLQKTVDCLIFCFDIESSLCLNFEMDEGEVGWPSKKDFNYVIDFIAFYVASKQAIVSERVLKHILQYLTLGEAPLGGHDQKTVAYQRERQVISLLQVAPRKNWDSSYVLDLCLQALYHQACGFIHSINGQFIAALDSYMKDMDGPTSAFAFIHKMLLQLEGDDHSSFRSAVISRFPDLVRLSREGAFFLVVDHYSEESQHILFELQSNRRSLFLFLKSAIDVHFQGTLNFASVEKCRILESSCRNINGNELNDLKAYLDRLSSFPNLLHRNPIQVTDEIAELYLELLCQYEHGSVLKFLETFENYNLEHCLRLCQDYGITDAAAFLLERAGDVGGAFSLVTTALNEKFDMLSSAVRSELSKVPMESTVDMEWFDTLLAINEVRAVYDILHMSISLCQRNSGRIDLQESESLWFQLLDMFCEPLRRLCCSKGSLEGRAYAKGFNIKNKADISECASIFRKLYSQLIGQIIDGMIGFVPVPKVMNKLLSDNGNQEFGDFKQTIMGMLGTYGFERRILDTAKSLIEDDTFYTMCMLKKGASHAYALQTSVCCICNCLLMKESPASSIRIYNCGHATHLHCESQENGQIERAASAGCPICTPQRKSGRLKNKGVLVDNHLIGNSASRGQFMQGGGSIQHLHEPEQVERSYGSQQMPRFEILNNLQKASRLIQIDSLPHLKLAPPAVYHEKVQKGLISSFLGESSDSTSAKKERYNRNSHQRKPTSRKRFHLRSSILS